MGLRKIWVIAFFICAFRASAKAEESIQELINKATTPFTSETRNEAWRVLSSRGEEAASALLERYNKTGDSAVRELILDYFVMLGPKMKGEMPALLKALLEADEKLVRRFSRVFNSFDSKSKADLYAHLKDKNAFVRVRCADALISFPRQKGSEDLKLAVPVLAEGMSTRETRVRREAAAGLKAAGMFAKNGEAGLLSKEGAVSLGKALKDEDPEMRRRVASILADFGTEAKEAAPMLLQATKEWEGADRAYVVYALTRVDPENHPARKAVPVLAGTFTDKSVPEKVRHDALWALWEIGQEASDAIPALLECIKDEKNHWIQAGACLAIGTVGKGDERVFPALREILKQRSTLRKESEGVSILLQATEAIGSLGPEGVPDLISILNDPVGWKGAEGVFEKAIIALGKLGQEAKPAVPLLTEILKRPDRVYRALAITVLGQIGPPASEALPTIRRFLSDQAPIVQKSAKEAIERIEGIKSGKE